MDFTSDAKHHGHTAQIRPMPSFSSDKPSFYTAHSGSLDGPDSFIEDVQQHGSYCTSHIELVDQAKLPGAAKFESQRNVTPAPTQDPRDPLNLTRNRKIIAVFFLCFFGAMAAAAELILGAMLPVFVIQYAGLNPHFIREFTHVKLPAGTNPLKLLSYLGGPPIEKVYLLGSLPVLMIGLSNLVLIPLASAVGRRPVILTCGVLAVVGCIWSGNSQSLDSHLSARCLQAIGAGTVESLIPFVISDLTFSDERNTWMSFVFATQGIIIVGLGFATPYIIIDLTWRWLYFITAIGASTFLVGVFVFLPETKWHRTSAEISEYCGRAIITSS